MERVSTKVGPLLFDHAGYDAEHDVLYLQLGEAEAAESEETPEGHVIRFAPGTDRIVGLTMMSPRFLLERDGQLTVTISERIEVSAEDLAPALATG